MSILKLEGITQEFGGLRALDTVSMEVEQGKIFGIIGPNGAGKTTLFNIITGIYIPTEGNLFFKDGDITSTPAYNVARLGIGRTFQNIRLFGKLSVIDNVKLGSHGVTSSGFISNLFALPKAKKEEEIITAKALDLLELVGLADVKLEFADSLAYGDQRRLEIARALALEPTLLLLDEPAAGMNSAEKLDLMELINLIKEEYKLTILLVEHDMDLVMNICDLIAVLDYGKKIAEGTPQEVKSDERVIMSYLGVQV